MRSKTIPVTVRSAEENVSFEFDNLNQDACKFEFPVMVSSVPRDSYIRVQIVKLKKKKDDEVLANVDFPVFDFNKAMFGSNVVLNLSLGEPDAPPRFLVHMDKALVDCPTMTISNNALKIQGM